MQQRRLFVRASLVMAACAGAGLAAALALADPGDTSTAAIGEAFASIVGLAVGGVVGGAIVAALDLTRAGLTGSVLAAIGVAVGLGAVLAVVAESAAVGLLAAVETVVVRCVGIAVGAVLQAI